VTEVGAAAALGKAMRRRRSAVEADAGPPLESAAPADPFSVDRAGGMPGPGPSTELLALFAAPRPRIDPCAAHDPLGEAAAAASELPASAARTIAIGAESRPVMRLYGALSVEGGSEAALRRRAIRGLIAYLALRRGPVGFDDLIDVLWPGQERVKARASLFKAKQHACTVVGEALERQGSGYALDLERFRVDVVEIERLARHGSDQAALERALELSVGAPLADVDYPFAEGERRRMSAIRFDLLARVARARLRAGDAGAALAAAEELISLDNLNELGWRLALEAEGALGARQAIVARYALLAAELDRTLGLRPSTETRETYLRLLGPG
jgi:DNA-binding SARP family transcriptional activator